MSRVLVLLNLRDTLPVVSIALELSLYLVLSVLPESLQAAAALLIL
jgi:hypothetical protein